MKDVELFSVVPIPKTLRNTDKKTIATFLSGPCQWYARQILISLGRLHFRKKSFNGRFNASHILFYDGRVLFDESLEEVDYTADTGKRDCRVIGNIFGMKFRIYDEKGEWTYPLLVRHLVGHLNSCPLGDKSNSAVGIALLINHPALVSFAERIAQCSILDSMVDRLTDAKEQEFQAAVGSYLNWATIASSVRSMCDTLMYDPNSDNQADPVAVTADPIAVQADPVADKADPHAATKEVDIKTTYFQTPRSCLKFSRNHFKHAAKDVSGYLVFLLQICD